MLDGNYDDEVYMSPSQTVLNQLTFVEQLVEPKRVARQLHRHPNYLSDICRREHVDWMCVFNEVLKYGERFAADPARVAAIAAPVLHLLLADTGWMAFRQGPVEASTDSLPRLCKAVGILLTDVGAIIETIAEIEDDGVVDEQDDVRVTELKIKAQALTQKLFAVVAGYDRAIARAAP